MEADNYIDMLYISHRHTHRINMKAIVIATYHISESIIVIWVQVGQKLLQVASSQKTPQVGCWMTPR